MPGEACAKIYNNGDSTLIVVKGVKYLITKQQVLDIVAKDLVRPHRIIKYYIIIDGKYYSPATLILSLLNMMPREGPDAFRSNAALERLGFKVYEKSDWSGKDVTSGYKHK